MKDDQRSSAGERPNGLSIETLKNFLWPIVLVGGLGGFIDFLIGKAGQVKAKDFLLKWWIRFDDVRWNNFGKEEELFAAALMNKFFSKGILSSAALSLHLSCCRA